MRHAGLEFDVTDSGPADGEVVVLLHGFPEDRQSWSGLIAKLTEAGYRALAPEQRGYSPSASPRERAAYGIEDLTGDVLALADAAEQTRFHLVGHDWGAALAWDLAARHPDRVRSLCAMSVPHPRAFRRAMFRSTQLLHSWYALAFQLPWLPERVLSAGRGRFLARGLERDGLDPETAKRYASRARSPHLMTGPVNWYRRVMHDARSTPGVVTVPTLYVWGEDDRYVTRAAAEGCGAWVRGAYRFVPLRDQGHWLSTNALDQVGPLLLDHLASAN